MTNIASARARRMRTEKTPAERKLWRALRDLNRQGLNFRQQAPIGPYIADFCDHSANIIVEVDGGQHGDADHLAYDQARTSWLQSQGYQVLRFWNNEVSRLVNTSLLAAKPGLSGPSVLEQRGVDQSRRSNDQASR